MPSPRSASSLPGRPAFRPRSPARLLVLGLVLTALGVGLSACAGSKEAAAPAMPEGFPNHSAEDIRQRIVVPTDTLRSYRADARVSVRSPQRDGNFNASLKQAREDSLLMSFSLFGFEGARMLVTPDSFFFYDRRKQRLVLGAIQDAKRYLPAPVASGRVFENMLGLLAPESSIDWRVEADSSMYYLTSPDRRRLVTIDPARWRVVRYAERDSSGSVVEERLFTDFQTTNGVALPRRVIFRRPGDGLMAVLKYRSITLNPPGLRFGLGVGPDVRRVRVPELTSGR